MKKIGFLKDTYGRIKADEITHLTNEPLEKELLLKISRYLSNGKRVMSFMNMSIDDETGEMICPDQILTDGTWMWPSYIFHFIERFPNINIDADFVEYVKERNFKLSHFDLEKARADCYKEMS
ncbi:MAG: hypothetical protein JSU09_17805 [Bacteroidetes bacterium]|nr:hypothetical protein [Bacteroidota bacterium]